MVESESSWCKEPELRALGVCVSPCHPASRGSLAGLWLSKGIIENLETLFQHLDFASEVSQCVCDVSLFFMTRWGFSIPGAGRGLVWWEGEALRPPAGSLPPAAAEMRAEGSALCLRSPDPRVFALAFPGSPPVTVLLVRPEVPAEALQTGALRSHCVTDC